MELSSFGQRGKSTATVQASAHSIRNVNLSWCTGLISFGTHVHVHELKEAPLSKVYVFRGTGDYSANAVAAQLGFRAMVRQQSNHLNGVLANKFLVSLEQAEYQVEAALDSLQVR
jgi:protein transport protein SEC23